MCVAAVRAVTSHDPDSFDSKRFRTFIFTMTKTYVHELAHVFVTFLAQGQIYTPPDVGAKKSLEIEFRPEAGRYVEKAVFGGLVVPIRNPDENDDQVSPHLQALVKVVACELIDCLGRRTIPRHGQRCQTDQAGDDR